MDDFIYSDPSPERYAGYNNLDVRSTPLCRVLHFLKTNLEPRQDLPPN